MKHIKCSTCKYVRANTGASNKNWTAFECENPKSDYYRCFLNVGEDGERHFKPSWKGCEFGECGR